MKSIRLKSDKLRERHIQKYVSGERILDIGSSEGFIHGMFQKRFPKKKLFTLDLKNADFNVDLDNQINLSEKFDTIIAGEIIEHLKNPTKFIEDCKGLLNPGGRLILTTPNAIGLQHLKNPSWNVSSGGKLVHRQTFTLPMISGLLKEQGMKIIYKDYINAFWGRNPLRYISAIIKQIKTDLIVVGEM